ncbi:hypothetical protein HDU76_005295 [Blyttiomyces sp. JEL0837]|nr:hypothetical protein HDU76_005295 [Blyttiomyces sp. JEL0837]
MTEKDKANAVSSPREDDDDVGKKRMRFDETARLGAPGENTLGFDVGGSSALGLLKKEPFKCVDVASLEGSYSVSDMEVLRVLVGRAGMVADGVALCNFHDHARSRFEGKDPEWERRSFEAWWKEVSKEKVDGKAAGEKSKEGIVVGEKSVPGGEKPKEKRKASPVLFSMLFLDRYARTRTPDYMKNQSSTPILGVRGDMIIPTVCFPQSESAFRDKIHNTVGYVLGLKQVDVGLFDGCLSLSRFLLGYNEGSPGEAELTKKMEKGSAVKTSDLWAEEEILADELEDGDVCLVSFTMKAASKGNGMVLRLTPARIVKVASREVSSDGGASGGSYGGSSGSGLSLHGFEES